MKKFMIILLSAVLLCGCGSGEVQPDISETSQTETATAVSETTAAEVTTASETTVTTVETTTVTTTETKPLTTLEKEYAWLEADREYIEQAFLYDFTGDGFPERMELILEPYVLTGCISSGVYGWQDNIVNVIVGDGMYVCRDSDGKNFIVVCYTTDAMAGMVPYSAVRYDFYSDGIRETLLGETKVYFSGEKYYTGTCTFLGEDLGSGIGKNGCEILNNRFMEYISEYELIDTITIEYKDGKFTASYEADADFAEKPSDNLPEYKITEIAVGNHMYDSNHNYVRIDEEVLAKGFDFDVLNEFENLDYVCFGGILKDPDEKIKIPKGDWRGKIKKMRINITDWDTSDLSDFTKIESIIVDGCNIESSDLEFLKDMPSVRYIFAYFTAASVETFIPLSEMPKLEAVIDSGHGSCMENLSDEEREKVMELLPKDKYFWGMVK